MYLEALNNGLIVPDPGVDLLSINNLPSVVYVTCYTDMTDNFSDELCQSAMDTFVDLIGDKKLTEAKTIIDPPVCPSPPACPFHSFTYHYVSNLSIISFYSLAILMDVKGAILTAR